MFETIRGSKQLPAFFGMDRFALKATLLNGERQLTRLIDGKHGSHNRK